MNRWERDRDSLAMNELGSNKCLITARESGFLQDLPQGAFPFGFIQEESNCLLKICECFCFRCGTGRNIKFRSVSNEHSAFFENLASELNFHPIKYSIKDGLIVSV